MKKLIVALSIFISAISLGNEFDVSVSVGVLSSITGGLGFQLNNILPESDITVMLEAGATPFLGEYIGGSIGAETPSGIRYGVFYREFEVFDGLWPTSYFDSIFDSSSSDKSTEPNSEYDVIGLTVSKVFEPDNVISPFLGLEIGQGKLKEEENWDDDEEGEETFTYLDFRVGFIF